MHALRMLGDICIHLMRSKREINPNMGIVPQAPSLGAYFCMLEEDQGVCGVTETRSALDSISIPVLVRGVSLFTKSAKVLHLRGL